MLKKLEDLKHPMQPIGLDERGVARFKKNAIVRLLLETSSLDLNNLGLMEITGSFPKGDYTQLMQLIGYSVSGFGELDTSPEEDVEIADRIVAEHFDKEE